MSQPARAAALLLALAACSDRPKPPPPAAPPQQAPAAPHAGMTLRDLAFATAVDARVAKLSLAASEVEARLASSDAKERAGAKALLPALDGARAEAEAAVAAVENPADRALAAKVGDAAREYARKLAAAAESGAPVPAELVPARDAIAATLSSYRTSRNAWRVSSPREPSEAEREFAEARRDMERSESAFMSRTRVAPREEGHEFDPAATRMTGQMALQRGRAAAERMPGPIKGPAARYAAAQEKVLEAVFGLQGAAEKDRPGLARAYHVAKVDALAALADYFAAVAGR